MEWSYLLLISVLIFFTFLKKIALFLIQCFLFSLGFFNSEKNTHT